MIVKKNIVHNNVNDILELEKFILSNPVGTTKFRYFNVRPYDIIKNHIYTSLYYLNGECIGYGHLDKENNDVWLGIIVSDNNQSKGFGNFIIDDLLSKYDGFIKLSVDKTNIKGQNLYKNKNFIILKENENNIIMGLIK